MLHLTSFDRWTGASAPAYAEVEALRKSGVDAHYAFAGGSSLEEKVGHQPFAHPILHRAQTPRAVIRSVSSLRKLVREEGFELIHSHLSHDHWLGYIARRPMNGVALVRTFHAARALRADMLTRRLVAGTDAVAVVSPALEEYPLIEGRQVRVTAPPAEPQYHPNGPSVRPSLALSPNENLIGFIGKISPGRGFEEAIRTLAVLRARHQKFRLMIIGRGEHRFHLEKLASKLGVDREIIWAGYHEHDLPEHFRAVDLMLFTARGSDEGHRAIIEAISCGTPVASYPIPGTEFILGSLSPKLVSTECTPESLADVVEKVVRPETLSPLRAQAATEASRFSYDMTAQQLLALYRDAFDTARA